MPAFAAYQIKGVDTVLYHEITCKTAVHKLKGKLPFNWDLNLYRGCVHGCVYCYALYSHQYIGADNFFDAVYVKTNIVEQLEKELRSPRWNREVINIGGVTDSYQPAEAKYKLMPEVLKLLIKYRTPVIISTKSTLLLRDYDLIDELSRITYVNIAATITTIDESLQRKIEPMAASSTSRFAMLREIRRTNASVGLHVMPIIPYLTDSDENLHALFSYAKECDVHYILPGVLYLRGKTRGYFLNFIQRQFPELYSALTVLYQGGNAWKNYKQTLYSMINKLRSQLSVSGNYSAVMKAKLPPPKLHRQRTLF